jgi:hypothetical protein
LQERSPVNFQITVAGDLTKGCETLMASQLVFVGNHEQGTFQGFILPKEAKKEIEKHGNGWWLIWEVDEHQIGKELIKEQINDPTNCLTSPNFRLFAMRDLAFYADDVGKSSSLPHWCIWCLLRQP